ncbi:hypothetical protein IEN85_04230 [Pelagicoccus sp. NFK12]|uniref:Uncharacterized protein n=1 Tax=Pelagicoccus enzymogenes TaxID=2773457 RepID=A0A927F7K4_9BACT|nr:hypothetical protein [Pelagicoccus enzymogenes]MBD5778686.1 hypothetical protein [Pelagicoccus enzymogenes]MDQ8196942.1 hypothetical protein [Pelagicoccus enzymogenes]
MNKTLLLILCDFLLLTILSMWKTEEEAPPPSDAPSSESQDVNVSAMAMMEQDLLDTLKYSLEEEQAERNELNEDLEAKAAELAKREEELAQRQQRIQNLESTLTEAEKRERELAAARERLQRETQELESQVTAVRNEYSSVSQQLAETQKQALENQAQSRLLQEELEKKLSDIAAKEAALAEKDRALAATQQKVQELDVQVRMKEQENSFLQNSVSTLKGEVVAEREERLRLQEQSTVLAQGVSELAASSQDLRQELRSSFEINANQLFADFKNNQIRADFAAIELMRNRFVNTKETTMTVLVSDGKNVFAIAHLDSLPFGLRTVPDTVRQMELSLSRKGEKLAVDRMQFLMLDPRIAVVPLTAEQAKNLGGKPYLTAIEPFKFAEAVLVNRQGDYYGEVEFKLDADTPGFVKMQNKIFSKIFGEFSPSTGDLVLSKTGELLGVMVNRRYCALVNNFVPVSTLDLSGRLDTGELQKTLRLLNGTLNGFPNALQ